jgi:putative FmdB family regulatory protein
MSRAQIGRPSSPCTKIGAVPIYEFECEECGARFEELVAADAAPPGCASCGSKRARRLFSNVSPSGRQPRGAAVRSDESRRSERESARQDRIGESRKRRAAGEKP